MKMAMRYLLADSHEIWPAVFSSSQCFLQTSVQTGVNVKEFFYRFIIDSLNFSEVSEVFGGSSLYV